ncbi:MAG: hypothetical protein LBP73_01485 [Clostridiales Family XIII bacterium]|jgi:hypothetical protein|nr:hypothetical protein [Clostridiales Family XIII bacterium]
MIRTAHTKTVAILLVLCLAAPTLAGCAGSGPEYDDEGNLIIPDKIQTIMERALDNVKSGGSGLNGKFANWHESMIASGLEHNYPTYGEKFDLIEEMRIRARARNAYLLYDYDAEDDAYLISLCASEADEPVPFNSKREASPAIREAFAGRGTVEMFAWEYAKNDPVWSAFMPVYNGDAEIVAVLGIDRIATTVRNFPEWNRDSRRWNGLTEPGLRGADRSTEQDAGGEASAADE